MKIRILLFLGFLLMAFVSLIHPGPGRSVMRRAREDMERDKRAGAVRNP